MTNHEWSNWETEAMDTYLSHPDELGYMKRLLARALEKGKGDYSQAWSYVQTELMDQWAERFNKSSGDLESPFRFMLRKVYDRINWTELAWAWIIWARDNPDLFEVKRRKEPKEGDIVTRDGVYFHTWWVEEQKYSNDIVFWVDKGETWQQMYDKHLENNKGKYKIADIKVFKQEPNGEWILLHYLPF